MSKKVETKKIRNMDAGILVPIVATVGAFTMIVLLRRMEHNEKMKMIEKGVDISKYRKPKKNGYGALKFALLAIGVGIGLVAGNMLDAYTTLNDEVCYFSMIFLFGGMGLLAGYKLAEQKEKENNKGKAEIE